MADPVRIEFQPPGPVKGGDVVILVGDDLKLPPLAEGILGPALGELVARLAPGERFKGKAQSALVLPGQDRLGIDRLVVVGMGGEKERARRDWPALGGFIAGKVSGRTASVVAELAEGAVTAQDVADMALGARLRMYKFDRYKTKKKEGENDDPPSRLVFMTPESAGVRKLARAGEGLAAGVLLARDLVNEPPNVLSPEEFAHRAEALGKLGVEVEVLDRAALEERGFRALLAVGQGSSRESRVAIMRWNGGKDGEAPVAFVGKGVCFDSGGISIKPSGGMEDMKGDMAGAACVVGLMQSLASRKAKANVVGAVGLTENMPDGAAQRPGDIITSLSGQTIEMINTDAEGRLVLADVLWYVRETYKPKLMVDLATLTGAILVALAQEYAGLFSNNDELAERLIAAGQATGERVWRMPLGPEFDKLIDSKFADMKNTGGRHGGSVTAAQFLQRYVGETPWAHLDIAGTAMNVPQTEINKSWASGWGVRLLDRLVRDYYEG